MRYSKSKSNSYRMLRNQLTSLFLYDKITTNSSRALALKKNAEKLLGAAREENQLNALRKLKSVLYAATAKKLLDEKDSIESISVYRSKTRWGDGSEESIVAINKKQPKK